MTDPIGGEIAAMEGPITHPLRYVVDEATAWGVRRRALCEAEEGSDCPENLIDDFQELDDEAVDLAHSIPDMLGPIAAAIADLAESTANSGPGFGPWNHLSCAEVQPIIDLLLAAGYHDEADRVLATHVAGDDDDTDWPEHREAAERLGVTIG